jgi:hypothetical protein
MMRRFVYVYMSRFVYMCDVCTYFSMIIYIIVIYITKYISTCAHAKIQGGSSPAECHPFALCRSARESTWCRLECDPDSCQSRTASEFEFLSNAHYV